jgi:hypothetical protein
VVKCGKWTDKQARLLMRCAGDSVSKGVSRGLDSVAVPHVSCVCTLCLLLPCLCAAMHRADKKEQRRERGAGWLAGWAWIQGCDYPVMGGVCCG